jgi:uncharacterized protein YkwD
VHRVAHRPRRFLLLLLAGLMAASVSLPVGVAEAAPTRTGAEQQAEARMFDQHNRARAKPSDFGYGGETSQKALRWAEDLAEVARDWSDTMARTGKFRHNPDLATQACCWRSVGENIAYAGPLSHFGGAVATADHLMQAWMDSIGHRRNILKAEYSQVGIGVKIDRNGRLWATAVFRQPNASAPAGTTTYGGAPVAAPEEQVVYPTPVIRDTAPACPLDLIPDAGFVDLSADAQKRAVNCLAAWEITGGRTETLYAPDASVRRDQMATFIARAIERSGGSLPTPTKRHFDDVPTTSPHAISIEKLAEANIIGGVGDRRFAPSRTVTRGQMARFLSAGFEGRTGEALPATTERWFRDTGGTTFERHIDQVAQAGWAGGFGSNEYRPGLEVRRDHMAYFLTRWLAHLIDEDHALTPASFSSAGS